MLWTKARILLILFNLSGKWAGQGWGGVACQGEVCSVTAVSALSWPVHAVNKLNKYFMKTPSFSCDCAHSILHTVSICTIAHANWPRILAKHQLWPQCPAMGQHCTEHIKHYSQRRMGRKLPYKLQSGRPIHFPKLSNSPNRSFLPILLGLYYNIYQQRSLIVS